MLQDYFTEASLCQDEIDQITELSERLMPTLDANDGTTLAQTLTNMNKKYAQVMAASHSKQTLMENKAAQWRTFQVCQSLDFNLTLRKITI